VTSVLERLVTPRGYPKRRLTDNGPEFAGKALARWADEHCVEHVFIQPGKPVQKNASIESFNGEMRNDCLNGHRFTRMDKAKQIIEAWRVDCNDCWPHRSLGREGVPASSRIKHRLPTRTNSHVPTLSQ
jgi:putative transposase